MTTTVNSHFVMSTIKIRSRSIENETEIGLLISHPMENGRRRDPTGNLVPPHYIRELRMSINGVTVYKINMTAGISKNPFFSFRIKNLQRGDKIAAEWIDNKQLSDRTDFLVETV